MKLIADLHTHSRNSRFFHGKSTVMQMIMRANELGLKELAITDHSFRHIFHTTKDKLYDARLTIDDMNKWSKTKVLLGIEANILNEAGEIDVDAETMALIDILVVGYHKCIKTDFAGFFGSQKKIPDAKQKATNAFLNAISKYPITILSHVNAVLDLDLYQIGKACAEKGVLVELNNRHCDWTETQIDELLASECLFVICSDAHSAEEIGEVQNCFDLILKYNIPTERIAGVEFEDSEMTEEHKEINLLYDEFLRKKDKVEKQERKIAETRENETHLSDEMEQELQKIAQEQGLLYTKPRASQSKEEQGEVEFVEDKENDFSFNAFVGEEKAQENDGGQTDEESENLGNTEGKEDSFSEDAENAEDAEDMAENDEDLQAESASLDDNKNDESRVLEDDKEKTIDEPEDEKTKVPELGADENNKQNAKIEREKRVAKVQSETLKRGNPVVVKNSKKKKEESPEEEHNPEDLINLFSVNVSQKQSKKDAKEIKEESETQELEKKAKPKKITKGSFVDVSSLTE